MQKSGIGCYLWFPSHWNSQIWHFASINVPRLQEGTGRTAELESPDPTVSLVPRQLDFLAVLFFIYFLQLRRPLLSRQKTQTEPRNRHGARLSTTRRSIQPKTKPSGERDPLGSLWSCRNWADAISSPLESEVLGYGEQETLLLFLLLIFPNLSPFSVNLGKWKNPR